MARTHLATAIVLGLLGCQDPDSSDEHLSLSVQAVGETSSIIASLSPEGYWRLGELSGWTMYDVSSQHVDGQYFGGYTLGVTGAILNDRDTAVFFWGGDGFAEIPRRKNYSLTRAWDRFEKDLLGNGWGATPVTNEWWTEEVTNNPSYYYIQYDNANYEAVIDPAGASGTFEQGLPTTTLQAGDMQIKGSWSPAASGGPLQPIVLVAQRTDANNMIRAELVERADHYMELDLIKVVNGVNQYIDQEVLSTSPWGCGTVFWDYTPGDWWFLRFQFDGPVMKARAWNSRTYEPNCWQAQGTATSSSVGSIAIRSANSASSVRPKVLLRNFWTQTLGFSVNVFIKAHDNGTVTTYPISKGGDNCALCTEDPEYYFRYESDWDVLKGYVFNHEGGKGAGQAFYHIKPEVWYHIVLEFDSGDANDLDAGVSAYIDGKFLPKKAGAWYNGERQCVVAPCPQEGVGNDLTCTNSVGMQEDCWRITPLSGDAPLRLTTTDPNVPFGSPTKFWGTIDEFAVFARKLTCSEVSSIYNAACVKPKSSSIIHTIATASSYAVGYAPSNAVDGSMSTRWTPTGAMPQWLTVDLGSVTDISTVKLFWYVNYATSYWIQVSNDNVNWTLAVANTSGDGGEDDLVVGRRARYIRLYALAASGRAGISLFEFQVYACEAAPANCTVQCNTNGICESNEDANTCHEDCHCNGDGVCKAAAGENATTCPLECP